MRVFSNLIRFEMTSLLRPKLNSIFFSPSFSLSFDLASTLYCCKLIRPATPKLTPRDGMTGGSLANLALLPVLPGRCSCVSSSSEGTCTT